MLIGSFGAYGDPMVKDRPLMGIALMLGFCVTAPFADALAKLLGDRFGLIQLICARMVLQVVLLLPLVLLLRISLRFSPNELWLTAIRAVLHVLGIGMMFLSLRYLPLADAVAIAFVMPFIMLLLGHMVLGEEVGRRRILACCVGFVGTLMVIQPSFAEVGWPALLPLGVAVDFALFMLVTRKLAKTTDPMALQVVSGAIAILLLLPLFFLFAGYPEFGLRWDDRTAIWILGLMGVLGTVAHLLATWALRFAPSTTLAPMQYLEIPVAAAVGWMLFQEFPNGLALFGILVTVLAGLYIIARERRLAQGMRPEPAASTDAAK